MREQGFRGNCDSQGKLGMCPSLAEPDSDGFPRRSVFNHKPQANKKFFDPTIFQKCWRGSGRAAHICGANLFLRIVFPAAIAFFETFQFAIL